MASDEVGYEVAGDTVGGVAAFGDDSGQEYFGGGVPFEVDGAGYVGVSAVQLGPAGASAGGLPAQDGEIVLFEISIVGEGLAEASAAIACYLNDALHFFSSLERDNPKAHFSKQ